MLLERQHEIFCDLLDHFTIPAVPPDNACLLFPPTSVLNALQELKDCGCDTSSICIKEVLDFGLCRTLRNGNVGIERGTYAKLVELGFQISRDDFEEIVVRADRFLNH